MDAERNHLVKVVFPELREWLAPHRVELIDIDLRWGITEEQSKSRETLALCLREVDACRPFFIGIVGQRYGWVPDSTPAATAEEFPWLHAESGRSVTELEMAAVLRDGAPRIRASFYFREAVTGVPAARGEEFVEQEATSIARLDALKARVRASGYPVSEYPARWDGRLLGLETFGARVVEQLRQAIREECQLPDVAPPTPADGNAWIDDERDDHERFMETLLRVYVGGAFVADTLDHYVRGTQDVVCHLSGRHGSGKSAALASFVARWRREPPNVFVLPHFVGAGPRSAGLGDMLYRSCFELKRRFEFPDEIPRDLTRLVATWRAFLGRVPEGHRLVLILDGLEQIDASDGARLLYWLPERLAANLKIIVSTGFGRVWAETNLIDERQIDAYLETDWVTRALDRRRRAELPLPSLQDDERLAIVRDVPSLAAKALGREQVALLLDNPVTTNPLYLRAALEELRGFGSFKALTQRIEALPKPDLGDEIYDRAGFSPAAMRRVGDPILALFTQIILRLESEFAPDLVALVLTLLEVSRHGLTERELRDLTSGTTRPDDLYPVLRQLRPYLATQSGLVTFYHVALAHAVRRFYFEDTAGRDECHARLADYFDAQDLWAEPVETRRARRKSRPPTPRLANYRKLDVLLFHRYRSGNWDAIAALLLSLDFLEAKVESGQLHDLTEAFEAAAGAMPHAHPAVHLIRLLHRALVRDRPFIAAHPTALFQALWNRGWWYDAPATAAHVEPHPARDRDAPWNRPGPRLHELLERWRRDRDADGMGALWIESLRPPVHGLDSELIAEFSGHEAAVTCMAWSRDGQLLTSGSHDQTLRVWHLDRSVEVVRLTHTGDDTVYDIFGRPGGRYARRRRIDAVAWAPGGGRLLSGAHDGVVRLWDYEYGRQVFEWPRSGPVTSLALSLDGRWLAAGTVSGHLRVFQMTDGDLFAQFSSGMIGALAWHPRGRFLTVGHENDITLYDVEGKVVGETMKRHERWVTDLAWSPDGTMIASGGADAAVCIWRPTPGQTPAQAVHLDEAVSGVGWSRDGRRLVVVTLDGVITLLDAVTMSVLARRHTFGGTLHDVAWSPVRELIATASGDGTVRVWGSTFASEPPPVRQFRAPTGRTIAKMAWALAGDRIAMTLDDGSVHVVGIDGRETGPWEDASNSPVPAPSEWRLVASASGVEVRAADGAPAAWYALPLGDVSIGSRLSEAVSPDGRRWAIVLHGVLHAFALTS